MNFMHIAGHLGADPEVRFTSSGKKVTTLRVATRSRKGQQDQTIWWRASVWGEQFDKMIAHLKKGSAVMVFGEMQKPEIFTDREGKPQVSMEISATNLQFSPFGKSANPVQDASMAAPAAPQTAPTSPYANAAPATPDTFAPPSAEDSSFSNEEVPF